MTTLVEEMPTETIAAKKFPQLLIEQTDLSIIETFGKMFGETKQIDGTDLDCRASSKIASMISFVGDMNWAFALVLPKETAESMAPRFAGIEVDFESEDIADITGELANIIAGALSGNLERQECSIQMSFPTILRGDDYEQIIPNHFLTHHLFFKSDDMHFWVKLTVMAEHAS